MFNFTDGMMVNHAQAHDVTFTPKSGQLDKTLSVSTPGTKVKSMRLYMNFLVVETKFGESVAIPVSNFKNIVMPTPKAENETNS